MSKERSGFQKLNNITLKASLPVVALSLGVAGFATFRSLPKDNSDSGFLPEEYCRFENTQGTSFTANIKYEKLFPSPMWEKENCVYASAPRGTIVEVSSDGGATFHLPGK